MTHDAHHFKPTYQGVPNTFGSTKRRGGLGRILRNKGRSARDQKSENRSKLGHGDNIRIYIQGEMVLLELAHGSLSADVPSRRDVLGTKICLNQEP